MILRAFIQKRRLDNSRQHQCNTKYSETEPTRGPSHSLVGAMDEKYQRLKAQSTAREGHRGHLKSHKSHPMRIMQPEVLGKGSFGKAYLVKNTEAVLPAQSSFFNLESFLCTIIRGLWHSWILKSDDFSAPVKLTSQLWLTITILAS